MQKLAQRIGVTLSAFAVVSMIGASTLVVAPQPAQALSTSAKISRIVKGDAKFKRILAEKYTLLAAETEIDDVEEFYILVIDTLEAIQDASADAKTKVPYVLFANVEEKMTLYAALSAIIAQSESYQDDIQVIYDQYKTDGDEEAAQTALTLKNQEITAYVNEHKDEFGEQVRAFLEAKLASSLSHTALGLTFLGEAKDAYVAMGEDTETLIERLDQAQTAYDQAESLYNDGKTNSDTKKLIQSAQWLLASRVVLLSAQGVVDALEKTAIQ